MAQFVLHQDEPPFYFIIYYKVGLCLYCENTIINISYIFISHDMNAVRAMSHQIMVMKDGKVIEQGSTKQIFEQPQQPYTQQLIQASLL